MYESQLMQLQQQTFNMEQAAMTTENLKNTVSALLVWAGVDGGDGNCRCDAGSQQGHDEAIQGYQHRQDRSGSFRHYE